MSIVYFNGEFIPQEQAKVSIMDRGFLYSDSIYESIPIEDSHSFGFDDHIIRLNKNLTHIHISPPLTLNDWHDVCATLINKNNLTNHRGYIYLHITRGVADQRQLHLPINIKPTVLAFTGNVSTEQTQLYKNGYKVIVVDDTRRKNRFIKETGMLPNILFFEQAKQAGVDDVILQQGERVLESSTSNVFIVKNNTLITPLANHEIIPGITRKAIIELAAKHHIECTERTVKVAELYTADEVWLTASNKDIVPIIEIDGTKLEYNNSQLWQQFNIYLQEHKTAVRKSLKQLESRNKECDHDR